MVRDLLRQERLVAAERPSWARSGRTAELYLQAGEWMLFILERDGRAPRRWTCVTAVTGSDGNTDRLDRGYIHTPPPPQFRSLPSTRVSFQENLRLVLNMRLVRGRRDRWPLTEILAVHRARRKQLRAERDAVLGEIERIGRGYEQARAHARELHDARYVHSQPEDGKRAGERR